MSVWSRAVGWVLEHGVVMVLFAGIVAVAGLYVAPFDHGLGPRDPIAVDAIPDLGENQQIVFTEWPGRSPRDVEDQVTYPLTTALLGMPGVRTVRSSSALGFSTIYVVFHDDVGFYWSRSRVLEKLASLPPGTLPDAVTPTLGPDATALGQVFWYTLEGRDPDGRTVGGWDPDELRAIQDWTVRYALQSVDGVSEVSSIGGFVREYQVDVDPDALRANGVQLAEVANAVRRSNLDVGARTLEINGVEYVVRGVGFLEDVSDLERTVVVARDHIPVRLSDVAQVHLGPALRRGALDDEGAPAVGGIVVSRYGADPLTVIEAVEDRIAALTPGLPRRVLEDGTVSQVTVVPFYDRSELIDDTLSTLTRALSDQLLVALLVVLLMLRSLRSGLLVASLLPLGVLGSFGLMKLAGVDANVMALGGIAIAIGSMVDLGIVLVDNMRQHLEGADDRAAAVRDAVAEVGPAVLTSVLTTLVSFLPILGLTASELRLFAPLVFTKSAAMATALVLALVLLPVLGLLALRDEPRWASLVAVPVVAGMLLWTLPSWWVLALVLLIVGGFGVFERGYPAMLSAVLAARPAFAILPLAVVAAGVAAGAALDRAYLPDFDEGAFLYMPTTPPHASMGEVLQMLSDVDAAIAEVPEVDRVVGKLGRADSALDPAPVSMIETLVTYVPEYAADGTRQWRDHIRTPDDIWSEIVAAAAYPGLTSAPELMPIEARLVMLQSGMRAPLGLKVKGPSLDAIETFGLALEDLLVEVDGVRPEAVFADRVVGKPYLEIDLDRDAIGRHGLSVVDVQEVLQVALGGEVLTRTVQGRERYGVRVRYMREDRDTVEALERVFVPMRSGAPMPLSQLADIRYVRGPQVIRSEDTFLTSYVLFDGAPGVADSEVVERVQARIDAAVAAGQLLVPEGVRWEVAGTYANQLRAEARLRLLVPLALVLIVMLLQLQFRRLFLTAVVASGVWVAVSGGFGLMWLYGQPWFAAALGPLAGVFQVGPVHLSVAAWVGVIALVGIATDDGVVMLTYLEQSFRASPPTSIDEARARTLEAGLRRIRPCLMTTATTVLALLPVVTSQGRGADLMLPMAIPMLGGMGVELITLFVVPALYCAAAERGLRADPLSVVTRSGAP